MDIAECPVLCAADTEQKERVVVVEEHKNGNRKSCWRKKEIY